MVNRMIFLTGYPRSGTTFLLNQLLKKYQFITGPETHYYRLYRNKVKNGAGKESLVNTRLFDFYNAEAAFNEAKESKRFLETFMRTSANNYRLPIIEKTPSHILWWEEILSDYPSCKFIFIVKDPRDVINSNLNVDWSHKNVPKHCLHWKIHYFAYKRMKNLFPAQIHLLKFEELVVAPEKELYKVANFLGLNEGITLANEISTVPDWEMKWKKQSTSNPDVSKIYKWKSSEKQSLNDDISYLLSDALFSLGYDYKVEGLPNLKMRFLRPVLENDLFLSSYLKYRKDRI